MSNVGFVKYCKVFFLSFFLSASNLVKKVFRQVWFLFCRVKSYLFKLKGIATNCTNFKGIKKPAKVGGL